MTADQGNRTDGGPSALVESIIRNFCRNSPENSLKNGTGEKAWGEPLVGFSNGADPLYLKIRDDIGPFYLTPAEIFQKAFPGSDVTAGELTVISWILPQTEATKSDNRKESVYPAERWARARLFGEVFNAALRKHVVEALKTSGFDAVSAVDSPFWSMGTSERYGMSSNWSERHAAHVSGLGTFGLCDGLITPVGKAMRCGSVIARIAIQPTPRPYKDHHEYCLYFSNGGACKKCIERCPSGAITTEGHDKAKCQKYLHESSLPYVREHYGLETYPCGFCQTGVPCESKIPLAKKRAKA